VTQAAVQQGVLTCASRINQVTNYLGFNSDSGAVLLAPPNVPDQRVLPVSLESPVEGRSAYVSVTFAPNQANGCGATFDAVVYWPQSCVTVMEKQFSAFKRTGFIKKNIAVLDGGISSKVFLMPAGNGCISIKKEVVL